MSQFNDAGSLSGWRFDYGGVTNLIEFDPSQDASNNTASGSLKVSFGFDAAALNPSGNNKGAVTIDLPSPIDGSTFVTMEMDLKIDPGSAADGSGNSGFFQMVIRNTGSYNFNSQFGGSVSTNAGWRHISTPTSGARADIRAITLELYGGAGLTGPLTLHVDNIKFTKPTPRSDIFVSQFNDVGGLAGWRFDYGGVTNLIAFDPSQDASNNPASGALRATFGFNAATLDPSGNNKGAITIDLPTPLDGSSYFTMEMDVKVKPGSVADGSGNSGYLQMVIRNSPFYDFYSEFGGNVSSNGGWRHITVSPLTGSVDDIHGITLELYGGAALTGPVTLYVDNLKFTAPQTVPPGPALSLERPIRGLNLAPTSGQYQRQNIATVSSGYGWVGNPEIVTYAVEIGRYPDASHSGFQTHIFLVAGSPGTDSAPDYNQPNVIFLDIQSQADGTAFAAFRYKTNEPAGNSFLYGAGTLGGVSSPSPLGVWSLSFSNNTNVTVTAPGGAQGNFALSAAAANLFANALTVYVGVQPNSGPNVGQIAVLNSFRILTAFPGGIEDQTLLEDNFLTDADLNTATWQVAAGDANGVQLVGADAAFWLQWTTPDSGFLLQTAPTLTDANSWSELAWAVPQIGTVKRILVRSYSATPEPGKIYAPTADRSFFRMKKP